MKICPKCKKELLSNATRCAYCGTLLVENKIDTQSDNNQEIINSEMHESFEDSENKKNEEPFKYCSNCGKKIKFNETKCPYCNYEFGKKKNKSFSGGNIKKTIFSKSKLLIAVAAVIVVIIAFKAAGSSLSKYEKLVYKNALTAQEMMKDPDSFKLGDNIYVVNVPDGSGNIKYQYTIMDYSSNNVFGVPIQDTLIFKDEDYVLSFNDSQNYDSLSIEDKFSEITSAVDTMQEVCDLLDDESVSKVKVDSTRIKRKMGIE